MLDMHLAERHDDRLVQLFDSAPSPYAYWFACRRAALGGGRSSWCTTGWWRRSGMRRKAAEYLLPQPLKLDLLGAAFPALALPPPGLGGFEGDIGDDRHGPRSQSAAKYKCVQHVSSYMC
jgi:hypothetical protein